MGARGPAKRDVKTISFPVGVVTPKGLTVEVRKEFERVVRTLTDAGTPPQQPDAVDIERYARAVVKERELFDELEDADWTEVGDRGGTKVHPKVTAWRACNHVISELSAAFGFNPAARTRIPKSGATGKSDNPLRAMIDAPKA